MSTSQALTVYKHPMVIHYTPERNLIYTINPSYHIISISSAEEKEKVEKQEKEKKNEAAECESMAQEDRLSAARETHDEQMEAIHYFDTHYTSKAGYFDLDGNEVPPPPKLQRTTNREPWMPEDVEPDEIPLHWGGTYSPEMLEWMAEWSILNPDPPTIPLEAESLIDPDPPTIPLEGESLIFDPYSSNPLDDIF